MFKAWKLKRNGCDVNQAYTGTSTVLHAVHPTKKMFWLDNYIMLTETHISVSFSQPQRSKLRGYSSDLSEIALWAM